MQQSGQSRDQPATPIPQVHHQQPAVTWNPSLEMVSHEMPALRVQFQAFSGSAKKGVFQKLRKKAHQKQRQPESLCIYHAETGMIFRIDGNPQFS